MGRKKSPVTRKRTGRRYVDPAPSGSSSLSASEMSDLLADVSPSSLRGLAAAKQEPDAMDTESSDSPRLPRSAFQGVNTALPIGGEYRGRRQQSRRKRRSSGDARARKRKESEDSSDEDDEEEEKEELVEMVTISVAELEKWQQRVIFHVEDHFTNEQLKRIAEFGRVHGSIVQEAREYVGNMELQLKNQFEEERASLRAQAEEFVAAENESLRKRVGGLEKQVEGLEKQVDTLEKEVDTLEKQVDALEQEVGALKLEKAQSTGEERQDSHEQLQRTHSPPNQQKQVQPDPADEEMDGNTHSHSVDDNQNVNRDGLADTASSAEPNSAKPQTRLGPTNHCSESKPTTSTLHQDPQPDNLLQQHQPPSSPSDCSAPPLNGIQPKPGLRAQCSLQSTTSPETSSELRPAGETG